MIIEFRPAFDNKKWRFTSLSSVCAVQQSTHIEQYNQAYVDIRNRNMGKPKPPNPKLSVK
jgi:hypothetical protein